MADYMPVKSAKRVLDLLERLASGELPTVNQLAAELGIPKSSMHALVHTMASGGWVELDPATSRLRIGLRALLVGRSYVESDDAVAIAEQPLEWLAEATGETVHVGRLDETAIVYLAKRESRHPLRMYSAIGRRLPAFTTALGKVILSGLPEDELDAHLPDPLPRLTANTLDRAALLADLAATRKRGYAIDNQESTEGIRGFAVALPTADPPTDAMSCAVPVSRLSKAHRAEIIEALKAAREMVQQRVGPYRPTAPSGQRTG